MPPLFSAGNNEKNAWHIIGTQLTFDKLINQFTIGSLESLLLFSSTKNHLAAPYEEAQTPLIIPLPSGLQNLAFCHINLNSNCNKFLPLPLP